jgi:imidazolonepropionase
LQTDRGDRAIGPAALLVEGAAEVATLAGGARRGSAQGDAALLRSGSGGLEVLCLEGRIALVATPEQMDARLEALGLARAALPRLEADGCLVTPGLIDAHSHLVFAGTRERELRQRQAGAGYLEILASGGGILATVEHTRAAPIDALLEHGRRWARVMLGCGVTTAEAKSGYGLDPTTELRLLEVIGRLDEEGPLDLVPTFLGAHAVPRELRGAADATARYVRQVIDEQLPRVAEQAIARSCDVFCEQGVFDAAQSRAILEAARARGLELRLHADEIADSGGAALAADLGAASADHLAAISDEGIAAMAAAAEAGRPVVATLLPATTLYLMSEHYAPARRLIEAGIPVALGTDFNPGTSPTPNLLLVMSLACLKLGLTAQEALVAVTTNAALALGLGDGMGTLEPGARADLVVWRVPSVEQLPYWLGAPLAVSVVKGGRVVAGVDPLVG